MLQYDMNARYTSHGDNILENYFAKDDYDEEDDEGSKTDMDDDGDESAMELPDNQSP